MVIISAWNRCHWQCINIRKVVNLLNKGISWECRTARSCRCQQWECRWTEHSQEQCSGGWTSHESVARLGMFRTHLTLLVEEDSFSSMTSLAELINCCNFWQYAIKDCHKQTTVMQSSALTLTWRSSPWQFWPWLHVFNWLTFNHFSNCLTFSCLPVAWQAS